MSRFPKANFITSLKICLIFLIAGNIYAQNSPQWKPVKGPLYTRWAKDISPENVHPYYPRPQMVRDSWKNLNGLWDYAIVEKDIAKPDKFDGKILVPFPLESSLSGVSKKLDSTNCLWYRKYVEVPKDWRKERLLLHFGAIDWESTIIVNNKILETHRGGYDPFTIDITSAIDQNKSVQEILIKVSDPCDRLPIAHGKQVANPSGIWYTSVTGIWQSVWIENVPTQHIVSLKMTPEIDEEVLFLQVQTNQLPTDYQVEAVVLDHNKQIAVGKGIPGESIKIPINNPNLWSPNTPFLYDIKIRLLKKNKIEDEVTSYFGMREIELAKDKNGINRLMLNHLPLFQYGPLDQGYWPEGLYTAPTEAAMSYDIEVTKKLGFNMIRKHLKVEPDRWYYLCDKQGILVWQDMPNASTMTPREDFPNHNKVSSQQFETELKRMIDNKYNHPCIVTWTLFNEGMGQYNSQRLADWMKSYDPTRIVNATSGWNDKGVGDIHDAHIYPGPGSTEPETNRAAVLGEFGGLGMPITGHLWQDKENWGYVNFNNLDELTNSYINLVTHLRDLVEFPGLSAAVYTQTTDVEQEINGFMTYDREVIKISPEKVKEAANRLYSPLHQTKIARYLINNETVWKYTTSEQLNGWTTSTFDDSLWQSGIGGFGESGSEKALSNVKWDTKQLWLRQSFTLDRKLKKPYLRVSYKSRFSVYINGKEIAGCQGQSNGYYYFPISETGKANFQEGINIIAVKAEVSESDCQFIDVQLVDVGEVKE